MICPDRTIHPKPPGATLLAFDKGWEAVRALRADREIGNIPVITCSWRQEANVDALVGEVAGHLQKPELLYERL